MQKGGEIKVGNGGMTQGAGAVWEWMDVQSGSSPEIREK